MHAYVYPPSQILKVQYGMIIDSETDWASTAVPILGGPGGKGLGGCFVGLLQQYRGSMCLHESLRSALSPPAGNTSGRQSRAQRRDEGGFGGGGDKGMHGTKPSTVVKRKNAWTSRRGLGSSGAQES